MSELIKRNARLLQFLCNIPRKQRQHLIKYFDRELIYVLREIAHNTLKSNVPLTDKEKRKLKKFKKIIRKLGSPPVGKWKSTRKYIIQTGRGILLPLLVSPILSSILQSVLQQS